MFIEYDAFFMGIAYVNEKYVDTIEPTYAVNATYILYIDKTYLKLGNNTISIISLNTFDNIDQFTVCIHK
ncbi:unnamed protein product [Heterobilharzia americana]|nr:unnamed protein product [Heterobilharzia americana]